MQKSRLHTLRHQQRKNGSPVAYWAMLSLVSSGILTLVLSYLFLDQLASEPVRFNRRHNTIRIGRREDSQAMPSHNQLQRAKTCVILVFISTIEEYYFVRQQSWASVSSDHFDVVYFALADHIRLGKYPDVQLAQSLGYGEVDTFIQVLDWIRTAEVRYDFVLRVAGRTFVNVPALLQRLLSNSDNITAQSKFIAGDIIWTDSVSALGAVPLDFPFGQMAPPYPQTHCGYLMSYQAISSLSHYWFRGFLQHYNTETGSPPSFPPNSR